MMRIVRALCNQVNAVSEGRTYGSYNAVTSTPAVGSAAIYAVGDFVKDSNTTVRGSIAPGVAASYVRLGWVCTVAGTGTGATFQEVRVATGA